MSRLPNGEGSSGSGKNTIVPKPEMLDFDLPEDALYSRHHHVGENVASSSGSSVRSFFIGMGFSPSLVDKVIEEKGEDDSDVLLETLIEYSDVQKEKSQSSGYPNTLFVGKDVSSCPEYIQPKEEPDVFDEEDYIDKRTSLLMMHFSENEVDFALEKLGEDAPVNELVDFIAAAQIAEQLENESEDSFSLSSDDETDQNVSNETLFGTMEKTLQLLEMGFSENEISKVIEKFGSEVPVDELADSIFTGNIPRSCIINQKFTSAALDTGLIQNSNDTDNIKTEDCSSSAVPESSNINPGESSKGKRPKEENFDDFPAPFPQVKQSIYEKNRKGKRPKQDYVNTSSSFFDPFEEKIDPNITGFEMPRPFKSNSCKSVDKMVAKPPYFFYASVVNLPYDCWAKISQFLYGIDPEFAYTRSFSALNRHEGYLHNLPAENRFHILPKAPLTIQDAIPRTKKWWPSWDTRKQLSCMGSEVYGASKLCDRIRQTLADSRGVLSSNQQKDTLRQCEISNLLWVGLYKLQVAEPEHWEQILGYPLNHTKDMENDSTQRLRLLKQSFQTDTLGYHLSVLKSMYPGGLTMLSVFSGIGGALVALHRLGIHLKGVVCVESCGVRQRIVRNWWHSSGQSGELVMVEDIQKLTSKRLESLIDKLGGIDLVICQNSSMMGPGEDTEPGFDFSLFNEFVRVLQRVRSMVQRRS
ncbi:hypothetical protein PTKIN_Ptkin10aG0003100 [Pterospermum kingtungense]